jgi:hypothetical protein
MPQDEDFYGTVAALARPAREMNVRYEERSEGGLALPVVLG